MPENTIIIAAGGTGGHIYPGIALATELKLKGFYPVFLVRKNDLCKGILEKEGFGYYEVPAMGLPRTLSMGLLKLPFVLMSGFGTTLALVRNVKPRVVVGMGG